MANTNLEAKNIILLSPSQTRQPSENPSFPMQIFIERATQTGRHKKKLQKKVRRKKKYSDKHRTPGGK